MRWLNNCHGFLGLSGDNWSVLQTSTWRPHGGWPPGALSSDCLTNRICAGFTHFPTLPATLLQVCPKHLPNRWLIPTPYIKPASGTAHLWAPLFGRKLLFYFSIKLGLLRVGVGSAFGKSQAKAGTPRWGGPGGRRKTRRLWFPRSKEETGREGRMLLETLTQWVTRPWNNKIPNAFASRVCIILTGTFPGWFILSQTW